MNTSRGAEWDSWYFLFSQLTGSSVFGGDPPNLLNALSLILFAGRLRGDRVVRPVLPDAVPGSPQLAFLVVAAFLLTNKVWSPQYSLWLVPLAALAIPRWRWVLAWQFAEALVWMLLMLSFDSDPGRNLSIYPFIGAAIVRDALLISLVVLIIRDAVRPQSDLVRCRATTTRPAGCSTAHRTGSPSRHCQGSSGDGAAGGRRRGRRSEAGSPDPAGPTRADDDRVPVPAWTPFGRRSAAARWYPESALSGCAGGQGVVHNREGPGATSAHQR